MNYIGIKQVSLLTLSIRRFHALTVAQWLPESTAAEILSHAAIGGVYPSREANRVALVK